ncbi:unnamed protein product [Clonostachys rhizophaga]|uniref:Uncharacterized protein n=1 Tax=Clonostachys rhizophaga TaxID=160324 RepID=A0A9N9VG74_9HYPO|nr:unnamed protein product [Clonostachys rhizophaga]
MVPDPIPRGGNSGLCRPLMGRLAPRDRPFIISLVIALVVEIPIAVFLSFWGAGAFARFWASRTK